MSNPHILKDSKLKIEKYVDGKKFILGVDFYQNNPNINVGNYDVSSKKYNSIRAGFDIMTFNLFLDDFEKIVTSNGDRASIENFVPDNKEMKLVSKISYGKTDKGMFFISLVGSNSEFPKVIFDFGKNRFHKFLNSNNEELTKEQYSKSSALTWIRTIRRFINDLIYTNYAPVEYKPNNNNKNKGSSYSKPESKQDSSYDDGDDLNF